MLLAAALALEPCKASAGEAAVEEALEQYAKKACAAGSKTSCDIDKLVAKVDSAGNTGARGNALFQSKCDAGNAMACGLLGENLLRGIGIGVDRERGITLLKKACDGGVDRACKKLAEAMQ
jgi:TPR repeat protein